MSSKLTDAQLSLKVLFTCFLVLVGIGYVFGLVNIFNNTGFSYTGLVVHYRGEDEALPPEFSFTRLIHEHHVHLFALAMLFVIVGWIFTMTGLPEYWKSIFVAAPFVAMFFDFASFWLLAFLGPLYAWGGMVFGGFMALSFFLLIGRPLYEMWVRPVWNRVYHGNVPWYLR